MNVNNNKHVDDVDNDDDDLRCGGSDETVQLTTDRKQTKEKTFMLVLTNIGVYGHKVFLRCSSVISQEEMYEWLVHDHSHCG